MADEKKSEAMSDDELDQIIQEMSKEDEVATAEAQDAISEAVKAVEQAATTAAQQDPAEPEMPAQDFHEAAEEIEEPVRMLREVKPNFSESVASSAAGDQSLKMELQGVVNLKVNFSSGGRSVELICSEEALVCRMADGTEFRIPLTQGKSKRNAA